MVEDIFEETLLYELNVTDHDYISSVDVDGEQFAILGKKTPNMVFKLKGNEPRVSNERESPWTFR